MNEFDQLCREISEAVVEVSVAAYSLLVGCYIVFVPGPRVAEQQILLVEVIVG